MSTVCVSIESVVAQADGHELRADANLVAVGELDRRGDPVDAAIGAVLAAEILEHRAVRGVTTQPRVTA